MPLISQNSLQWKTLSILSYTKPCWEANYKIESGPVMISDDKWRCHLNTYLNSRGHYYIKWKREYGPNSQRKGHSVRQNRKKEGSTGEKWDFTQNGVFLKIPNKMCFVTSSDGDLWKISYILNKFVFFFIQKIKNIGVIVWLICNFWSKTNMGSLDDRSNF